MEVNENIWRAMVLALKRSQPYIQALAEEERHTTIRETQLSNLAISIHHLLDAVEMLVNNPRVGSC